ncbi:helix-turn-helix domain-containing protein [Pediococcus pentosaceus]
MNLYKQGESAAQLAREYGIGYSTVHKWIQGQAKTQSGGDHGPSIRRPRF